MADHGDDDHLAVDGVIRDVFDEPIEEDEYRQSAPQNPYTRSRPSSTATSPGATATILHEQDYGVTLAGGREDALLTTDLASKLHAAIPARWRLLTNWRLMYSTETHGFSLSTLYYTMRHFDGACLLVVKAMNGGDDGGRFGAFCTSPLTPHPLHFGSGECFLFTHTANPSPTTVKYASTGKNDYYLLARQEFVAVGCGEGRFGLWLDGTLGRGCTSATPTYDNRPLVGGDGGDGEVEFVVEGVEVWGLAHPRSW
jgi:hypothetical protein